MTIDEPIRDLIPPSPDAVTLDRILGDLREWNVPATPLSVICRATDLGASENIVLALAAQARELEQ
jgi:hypothetical protein